MLQVPTAFRCANVQPTRRLNTSKQTQYEQGDASFAGRASRFHMARPNKGYCEKSVLSRRCQSLASCMYIQYSRIYYHSLDFYELLVSAEIQMNEALN